MKIEDCFRERLLRKIKPDLDKSQTSLKVAEKKLKEAKDILESEFYDMAILLAYTAMFHSARSLLYKDGVQEKSHYAVQIYLKEEYGNKLPISTINSFDVHRVERHDALYGLEYKPEKEDAESAISDAENFIKEIKIIIS